MLGVLVVTVDVLLVAIARDESNRVPNGLMINRQKEPSCAQPSQMSGQKEPSCAQASQMSGYFFKDCNIVYWLSRCILCPLIRTVAESFSVF